MSDRISIALNIIAEEKKKKKLIAKTKQQAKKILQMAAEIVILKAENKRLKVIFAKNKMALVKQSLKGPDNAPQN